MNPRPSTLPALLAHNADVWATKPVIVAPDEAITHAALQTRSRALAGRLIAAGVSRGSRVGVLLANGVDWAVVAGAAWQAGSVLVPLSTLLRPPELAAQLQVAAVTHLVTASQFRGRVYADDLETVAAGVLATTAAGRRHPTLPALRAVWTLDAIPEPAVDPALTDALAGSVRPADDLVVLFTSGSRGRPKGTVHTHGSALRAVASGLEARRVGPDDRLYIPMPFFWTGGLAGGLLSALVAGATLLTEAEPEPGRTLALLEREHVTLFRGWPDQAAALAAHPAFATAELDDLRPASLPAVLPADQRPVAGARANLFGMTETFGPYCGAPLDEDLPPRARGSCGRPFAGIEVRIQNPDSGEPCPATTVGEIHLRGPNLMRQIRGLTRDATFAPDGAYPTGDLGAVDADGYLSYHGRRDDMFKVKGATVYPDEVAAALREIAGVLEAHVTDVRRDDGPRQVGALVVGDVTIDDLVTGARTRLSAFKVPTVWVVGETAADVPRTATAKVDKVALQTLLAASGRRVGTRRDHEEISAS